MNFIKKLAGETVIYGLGSVLPKILNFLILAPYLTRIFATDAYGIHGIIYGFAGLMIVFTTFRMETSFFRFASKNQHSIGETYSTGFIGVLIVSVLWFFIMISFSDTISNWLNIPGNAIYIKYFAWIVLFDALSALSFARLRMENKAKKFAWIKIINVLVNVIVIIFFLEVCPYLYQNKPESVNWFYDQTKELDYVFIANLVASFFVFLLLLPILIKAKIVFN
ncbi:MAG: oligosaccharide flippase family protein, partial [Bacteroidetes bacterium]|nr:oligosaccharide flippase family protein [Bacteroidota bacterium]